MAIFASVVLCTHNPRRDYLDKVVDSLRVQTLPLDRWELLIIDNASHQNLRTELDLSWHPKARIIREDEIGLTAARLRGIAESTGEMIVFVDDDNVLSREYLQVSGDICESWPILGVWGGNIAPEFETPPPDWTKPYWKFLAIRHYETDVWSNNPADSLAHPVGAGLCIRRTVAQRYVAEVSASPIRKLLDRRGNDLMSGGDSDIVLIAHRHGFGFGVFRSLSLTHLIAAKRLSEDYLVSLLESMGVSVALLEYTVHNRVDFPPRNLRFYARYLFNCLLLPRREMRFYLAELRSRRTAQKILSRISGDK